MSVTRFPDYPTVPEAAEYCNVSPSTIRRVIKQGDLRTTRILGCIRIHRPELQRWLDSCQDAPGVDA